jgi:hypothetical protein
MPQAPRSGSSISLKKTARADDPARGRVGAALAAARRTAIVERFDRAVQTTSDNLGGIDVNRSQMVIFRVSRTMVRAMFAALAFVLVAQPAMAQSTIFNIPSTDTVEKGKGYFEIDLLPQAPKPDGGFGITIINPRILFGVAPNVEVGLNFPVYHIAEGTIPGGTAPSANFAYIQPNIKWKFFNSADAGVAASVGLVVNAPLNNREGQATWSYIYANVSKKFKGDYGPRVTFGPYGVLANADPASGPVSFFGPRGGVLAGYEQPIGGKVSFVADWFSGQNSLGYFTPGISITLPHSGLFNIGYSFGNDSIADSEIKNRYLFAYYGVTF